VHRAIVSPHGAGMAIWFVFKEALTITAFVAVIMIAIEYVNIRTRGLVMKTLGHSLLRQYVLAAVLGATPGCLGAFVLVALFTHRRLSPGALAAGMIATSGDEMFVMLALMPRTALLMTAGLMILGVAAGWTSDRCLKLKPTSSFDGCDGFDVHEEEQCRCLPRGRLRELWKPPSPHRAILAAVVAVIILSVIAGKIGPPDWDWKRVTLLCLSGFAEFIVLTVPDHFLDQHLWNHVSRKHIPQLFLWTLGAMAAIHLFDSFFDLKSMLVENRWLVLLASAIVGIIPESGPHLLFVNLFVQGIAPLSVLVASSVVQDGHGMLPLLAHSRRDFLRIKAVNLLFGLGAGALLMAAGF